MKYIESPLNYIGGKEKLLSQIFPFFPKNINTFVDLFCGGGCVGINTPSNKVIFNDKMPYLIEIYKTLKEQPLSITFQQINNIIRKHNLSKNNKKTFLEFREYINSKDEKLPIEILTIIFFSFNNQIRFNSKGHYMTTSGKGRSNFNSSIKNKLQKFILKLQKLNCEFSDKDFREFNFDELNENDFVYIDPPYFLTDSEYCRKCKDEGWNENTEKALYDILLGLNSRNIKWALSNVLEHKGKFHHLLDNFVRENNFNMIFLNKQYNNCSYGAIKKSNSKEVLVTNYLVKRNTLF